MSAADAREADAYFLIVAAQSAALATCDRKHVGAALVVGGRVVAVGANRALRGLPQCTAAGHLMEHGHCVRTVHAEANAVAHAARRGVALEGASLYVTAFPCWGCFRLVASVGVRRIVYAEAYREDARVGAAAAAIGLALECPTPLRASP